MYKSALILGLSIAMIGTGVVLTMLVKKYEDNRPCYSILSEIEGLFPRSKEAVESRFKEATDRLKSDIDAIISVGEAHSTFDTTFMALDKALERFNIMSAVLFTLSSATPDEPVREATLALLPQVASLSLDMVTLNKPLYETLKVYVKKLEDEQHELLNEEQKYYIKETMKEFERSGLGLGEDQQKRVRALQQEQASLMTEFNKHIAAADGFITVDEAGLKGLEESFIKTLQKTVDGNYTIPTDYAHYYKVMEQSEVADTRMRLYRQFNQRAYPENDAVLKRLIAVSDELAKVLGYRSYAHYSIADEMAKTPETVETFLKELRDRAWGQATKETALLMKELPKGVEVIEGKFYPWDISYVFNLYKKNHFKVDEVEIAEYFPIEYTLPALLHIYEDFFGLGFKKLDKVTFWHEEVQAYAVYKDGIYRGIILLDLFPRQFKYSHAGHLSIVPAVKLASGKIRPSVALVVANFSRPHADRPSLLKRSEVNTFFHEFGHALHALLGATELASFSGTSVKKDFVEMPSQMLEEWLWDPSILKRISSHYKTKESLPDEIISNLLGAKQFGKADWVLRQGYLAALALAYYMPGADKDLYGIMQNLQNTLTQGQYGDPENRFYASFNHLAGYGPRYYGYLWALVYALDLFAAIKPYGLTNPVIGTKYAECVLSKGGSVEPDKLLEEFLGRKPSTDAFFDNVGI